MNVRWSSAALDVVRDGYRRREHFDRSDGTICRLALETSGNTSLYTPYLETWFEAGRSFRSSNQVRWEDTNDAQRHPLHQKVLHTYEELLDYHLRLTAGAERALEVVPFQRTPWEGLASRAESDGDEEKETEAVHG